MSSTTPNHTSATSIRGASDAAHPRVVLMSLWTTMLFVFAYVDIFAFWRADVIEGSLAGTVPVSGFTIDQRFLVLTTLYVLVPSLMIAGSTMLPWRILRPLTIGLAGLYAATITASTVGEPWAYYLIGSAVEVAVLIVIILWAWRHRTADRAAPTTVDA
ncbi:MAG: hypothetical protein CSA84_05890 [Actinomycetales bacterium]|nr:MAG: hypothetical protein CSA84_05890 [Actinomycetales bacterium]